MAKSLSAGQVAGLYRRNVGSFNVATMHDDMLEASFDDVVGTDPSAWEAAHRAGFRPVPPRLSCNTSVVERRGHMMLVDAGCGALVPGAGQQVRDLDGPGIQPSDVDTVLMTHLHIDHAAGLVDAAGTAVFPDAELVVHHDELAFWRDQRSLGRLRESQKRDFGVAGVVLRAYADRIRSVTNEEVLPGVTAIPTPGHTPAHTAWLLDSSGEQLLIWGDMISQRDRHAAISRLHQCRLP